MKLLIVDDQLATLNGLTKGIDWAGNGFTTVDTAQNAMEARISFAREVPDLMLCDIEMPVESGLDLSSWVRAQGYRTKIIFLTCHSDFEYAQEAIRLGVSDYIVQPAPYHRILEKAKKVMETIASETSDSRMISLGKTYTSKETEINAGMWRGFLMKTVDMSSFAGMPGMPCEDQPCILILIQLVQMTEKMKEWSEGTLAVAMRNTIQDTFDKKYYCRVVSLMEHNIFALAVQKTDGTPLIKEDVISHLHYLESMFDMYMPCSLAFYLSPVSKLSSMPEQWDFLRGIRNRNVTGRKGVYSEQNGDAKTDAYKEQYYRWNMILKNAGSQEMAKDALQVLHQLSEENRLNGNTLLAFHRDFTRMMLMAEKADITNEYLITHGSLYSDAMHSQTAMEELISNVGMLYEDNAVQDGTENIAKTIRDYIDDHLSENIRKEDLTELMHLNEDYLTRIFKKETGMSIKAYIIHQKMNAARELLQTTSLSVSSVAIQLGYNNFSHFSASYKKEFGITPAEEKENRK